MGESLETRNTVNIFFTDAELWQLRQIAIARNGKNPNIPNRRVDKRQGDIDINYKGVKAEYAVSKFLKVPFDLSINLDGGDDGKDMYYGSKTIDVKFNNYKTNAFLYFNSLDDFKADIAVLVVPDEGEGVELLGWITRGEFIEEYRIKDFGYGVRYALPLNQLKPIKELKEVIA